MARCPFAVWKRLPGSEPAIKPRTFIYHTAVGTLPGVDAYFRSGRSGGIESHFGVGGPWEGAVYDGVCWQWRDTDEQADANLHANDFAISVETSDGGDPRHPWSDAQVEMLVRLGRWARQVHGIPARICPAWDAGGFGWHAMWGAPSNWTPSAGKTCPGATRIAQLKAVVLPRVFAAHDRTDQEDDMTPEQADQLSEIHDVLFRGHALDNVPIDNLFGGVTRIEQALIVPGTTSADTAFNMLFARVRSLATAVGTLQDPEPTVLAKLDAVLEALDALAPPPPPPGP